MDKAELEKQRRYFWDSALTVMLGPPYETSQDITAYPNDTLTIKHGEGDEKTYRMYSTAWMRSLDYLLYRYLTLVLHNTHYSDTIMVPVEVRAEYTNYRKNRSRKRQNKDLDFVLPDYYRDMLPGETRSGDDNAGYEYFKTSSPVAPAILNAFCHGLFPQANSEWVRGDPRRNAKLYELDGYSTGVIPDFKPEDYIAYELMTGLSLSIEIMAIILEMDPALRKEALNNFFRDDVHNLVSLPFPYARAAAARNYFLQIQMYYHKRPYQWSANPVTETFEHIMELAAYSASGHINILYHTSFHPEVPENVPSGFFSPESERIQAVIEYMHRCDADHTLPVRYEIRRNPQTDTDNEVNLFTYQKPWYRLSFPYTDDPTTIESYKNQLLKNLEVVESPPDCKKILDTKPEHLAVFTNPDHKYVPLLMHYVKTGTMLNCFGGDTLPMPTRDCERLFHKICYCVRIASINNNRDIHQIKHFLNKL